MRRSKQSRNNIVRIGTMSSSFRFVLFECVGEKLTAYGGLMSSLLTYCLIGGNTIDDRKQECTQIATERY
ncbi:hypothetical protein RDWZM_000857 [Blomia tropicalis]|uniref:Uncharacterized protein n=1 Tax=Blomia tropicalis TaxID=40697 RepID=A0A9Q0MD60_BLOTA|nr:hypothetical protein RDWZM_000857 [Blomia tropicalis]